MKNNKQHTNKLIAETSPYLLQHAHNPVNWYPWGKEALALAKQKDKLLLISIGYSACHWCHVMERESFEDEEVAQIMNEKFICIKVDREERPDIDQVYMAAVQLMTGHGGWPLNCIALPDGKPIYGGTYFTKEQWLNVLVQVANFYDNEKDKAYEYAEKLTEGIRQLDLVRLKSASIPFTVDVLKQSVEAWSKMFDHENGGTSRAPKFPLPNNYIFLLRYGYLSKNKELTNYVEHTLTKMAFGGIYDHLGGGFARYSTDMYWKVPHFEKMLYDNAQLISLYTEAFLFSKKQLYKNVVYETCDFILREMTSPEGAFYSAYDADSEGEEGAYYVWNEEELRGLLGNDFDLFSTYYNINKIGYWENGNYILLRNKEDVNVAKELNISEEALVVKINSFKTNLLAARDKRVKPGLDDKSLTSWNALMLKAFADAYNVFREKRFLDAALANASFILKNQLRKDGGLNHSYKKGKSTNNGYLEDYAFVIEAFLALYRITFDELWLHKSKQLLQYSVSHFYDSHSGMFWFTSDEDADLIARKMEISDNVISASNSVMAHNIFMLSKIFDDEKYYNMSKKMLNNVVPEIRSYGPGYSNWASLMLNHVFSYYEIAVVGSKANDTCAEFSANYTPNILLMASEKESELPSLAAKYVSGKTLIYVCRDKTCGIPFKNINDALKQVVFN